MAQSAQTMKDTTSMPTRADLYAGNGPGAEWLGSYKFDGEPAALDKAILKATSLQGYREAVFAHLNERHDATLPHEPWPWLWEDSSLTEYAYTWSNGALWACGSGEWFLVDPTTPSFGEWPEKGFTPVLGGKPEWPNMKARKYISRGRRMISNDPSTTNT
jgi:hypothetical protein